MRKGLLNCTLESDLDANFFEIINLKSSGSTQGGITYVDSMIATDNGVPGTATPFKTVAAALAATPDGYNIVIRPGTYTWDGFINVDKSVNIFGYGAIISPASTHHAGLLVSADNVQIHGIQFDGGFVSGLSDDDTFGCVAVTGSNLVMVDLWIHNQHNVGIELRSDYGGVRIQGCGISTSFRAITGEVASNTAEVNIINNVLAVNRQGAIYLNGDGNVSIFRIIRIVNNEMFSNDTANQHAATISFPDGGQDIKIIANQISDSYDGINLTKITRASIQDNTILGCTNNIINIFGHKKLRISGNILDGVHATTGATISLNGIVLTGDYETANDSGISTISDNDIYNIASTGYAIKSIAINDIKISGNHIRCVGQTVLVQAFAGVEITDNRWTYGSNALAIQIGSGGRASSAVSIRSNHFELGVATATHLIGTSDTGGDGIDDVEIIGNTSTNGKTYSSGIVANDTGTAATNLRLKGNSPIATGGPTTGWINDDDPVQQNTVFVSKLRGNNATALRESKAHPFLTINAAVQAATSGDTVYIQDGVFDELIVVKDGITVRFMPEATLVCVTANGCLISNVDGEVFTLYHEHAPIKSSKAGQFAVGLADAGTYILYCDIENSGTNTGTFAHGLLITDDAGVYLHGSIYSSNGQAISVTGGTNPNIFCYPVSRHSATLGTSAPHLYALSAVAIGMSNGYIQVDGFWIFSGGNTAISIVTGFTNHSYKRCTINTLGAAKPAVTIVSSGVKNPPTFRDCILISEGTATGSLVTNAAQDVTIMGTVIANKGADPPTNITFQGGGTYTVDADCVTDTV